MHFISFYIVIGFAGFLAFMQMILKKDTFTQCPSHTVIVQPVIEEGLYDFHHPQRHYVLPKDLNEISGITVADGQTLYCVQDESGTIYKFDLQKGEITGLIPFGDPGDYEDLAIVDDVIFVLRSDAVVFKVDQKNPSAIHQTIPVSCENVEGLTFSASDNMMYLACKSAVVNRDGSTRQIYQFSPDRTSQPQLAFAITQQDIQQALPTSSVAPKQGKMQFNPSGIAIHPRTKDTYVLSASQRFVAVYRKATLQHVFALPEDVYYQPEGIAFAENGDLYLASEGSRDGKRKAGIYYLKQL